MDVSHENNNKLILNLPQLQNLIKRDPVSYAEEFERQHSVYAATLVIFEQNPTVFNNQLHELLMFMAQVAQCYPKELDKFPQELMTLLKRHASVLHPEMRMSLVKALVLLRNKNLLSPTDLHILFFQLLRCQDKNLRKFLQQHMVKDIKNLNSKSKNMKLNKELQNFMYEMLKAKHAVAAKTSLNVMLELYNKKIWNDAKTVNIITTACFHKVTKIMVAAIKFFVGKDDEDDDGGGDGDNSDSDGDEDEQAALKAAVMAYKVNKKTKKRKQKKMQKVKNIVKKNQKNKTTKVNIDFSALHLIHDPQDMAERLYRKLENMNERFEVKLLTMNLISRLIGIHKLYLPNFYPLLQRYLYPHQREVTKVMVFAAQAAHDEVPPDDLEPVVRCLANNFVTERYSSEVMAMGLNAIRELCARNPHGMADDLLQDLAQYKTHKDKGVSMAARSLIVLFRDKNPMLLSRKDRGAPTELKAEEKQQMFGETNAKSFIPGAEILSFKIENEESDDSNSEGEGEGWIDVDHPEIYMDGSDDEEEGKENEKRENSEKALTTKEAVKEVMKLTVEERAERAEDIVSSRFLTDQDFAKIAAVQAAKYVEKFSLNKKNKVSKRKLDIIEEKQEAGELVPLKNIEMIYKKRKHDKEARMGTVLAGREGREKYGQKKGKMNPHASTTNRQKNKGKNFMMMKHKVKGKQKKSFREKQLKLRNSLLKQRKFKV
ncbi:protein SDA1 homolog [Macrobrachium nipponense]|uniref:protein SDA1 homolog n=1 Tax=Macrobrachium nipponense TaxID=159736 RepID=UPI0030C7ACE8